jgi:phospholipid/cholesterol/gamma-HCH transport system substrate-binding protein
MRRCLKMRKKRSEIWVGIFVVIGIVLLVAMTLKIEKFQFGKEKGYLLNIYFSSAAGLDRNSPIRVAGVHVGNVEKVLLDQGKAKVTFRLPLNVILYKDAKAYMKSEGFLGEKYIEISPGTLGYPRLEPNEVIEQGAPPADVEQFLSNMSAVSDEIKEVVKPLGDVLKAVDTKKVEGMIDNLNKFSGQLTGIADESKKAFQKGTEAFSRIEEIGDEVRKGEGTLGKLITDETIYREAKKTVDTAKEAIETVKNAAESAKKTVDTLKDVSERIERGEGTLGKLIKDESLYQEAKETIQSVKGITEKVEKGEGALGKLVNDDTLIKEAEKTMKKVQKAAEGMQEQTPISVLGTIIGIFF